MCGGVSECGYMCLFMSGVSSWILRSATSVSLTLPFIAIALVGRNSEERGSKNPGARVQL